MFRPLIVIVIIGLGIMSGIDSLVNGLDGINEIEGRTKLLDDKLQMLRDRLIAMRGGRLDYIEGYVPENDLTSEDVSQ